MKQNEGKIIEFPEYKELKQEIQKIRTEMSMLLLEHDELKYVECKNIETAYMLALGNLEYKIYKLNCVAKRLKRKTELIQARKNIQESINIASIEETLDNEFKEYKSKLNERLNKMNIAIEWSKCKTLSDEESKELKKLYRSVIKALHPDLHPKISQAELSLFHNAVSTYENGDLKGMRIISEMVSDPQISDCKEDAMDGFAKEKKRLTELLETIKTQIEKIKNEYPYNLKPLIQNEEKISERRTELENCVTNLNNVITHYKAIIEEMLR